MALINYTGKRPGDIADSTEVETFFEDVEDVSENIINNNVKREALTCWHFTDSPSLAFVGRMAYDGPTPLLLSATFFVAINAGTLWSVENIDTTVNEGDVISVSASVLMGECFISDYTQYEYMFKIIAVDSVGGQFDIGPLFVYGLAAHQHPAAAAGEQQKNWQRHLIEWDYIHTSATPVIIDNVRIVGKIRTSPNQTDIERYNLDVRIIKR